MNLTSGKLLGGFAAAVLHVVRAGDNQLGALAHEVFHDLGNGQTGAISRIDLVQVDHLRSGKLFFNVLATFKVSLAPTLVVVRTNHQQAENVVIGCHGRRRRYSRDSQQN